MLLLTAAAKLFSAGANTRILEAQDTLSHLSYRPLMIIVAALEIAVAVFLLKSQSSLRRSLVLFSLSANFIAYRVGNYLLGIHTCPCLGNLADRLPLPRGLAGDMYMVATPRHGDRPASYPAQWPQKQPLPGASDVFFFDGHAEPVKLDLLWQLYWHVGYKPPAKRPGLP